MVRGDPRRRRAGLFGFADRWTDNKLQPEFSAAPCGRAVVDLVFAVVLLVALLALPVRRVGAAAHPAKSVPPGHRRVDGAAASTSDAAN
jgi:hypothetical protein